MFDNIGKKIKILAKVLFWIGVVVSFSYAIACMILDVEAIPYGLLFIIIVVPFSLISSWFLYGYGEIIENTAKIATYSRINNKIHKANTDLPQEDIDRFYKAKKLFEQGLITEEEYKSEIEKTIEKL